MTYITISFYRYFSVDEPLSVKNALTTLCTQHHLLGRILIAKEGINAAVSGKKEDIEIFKENICKKNICGGLFSDLTFREQEANELSHHKLTIKIRKEIVHFGKEVDLRKRGKFLKADELQRWYEQKEKFNEKQKLQNELPKENPSFIVVDARNDYEWNVGKFKDAVTLPIRNFRDFPEQAKALEKYKDKKMVLYCTGGIRCEKASAYLQEQGFSQVYHIEGGIINYLNHVKSAKEPVESYWQGGLFVFDDRLVSETGKPITSCMHCGKAAEKYQNCFNLKCDTLFVGCGDCLLKMKNTCSKECKGAPLQREVKKLNVQKEIIGKVENYYAQKKVALVRVEKNIEKEQNVCFSGKTTAQFTQRITELRNEEGEEISCAEAGEIVTFFVDEKVRKGDMVVKQ